MPDILRPGARVHYTVEGDGPVILMGHCLMYDRRLWDDMAQKLAERYRVIRVDARGHGWSTANADFTLEDLADDWVAILDAEGVDRAVLVGLSMGALTAMRVAVRAPSRVAGLALFGGTPAAPPLAARVQFCALAQIVRVLGLTAPVRKAIAFGMFGPTTRAENPAVVEATMAHVREQNPRATAHAVRAIVNSRSIRESLKRVDVPTLVVVGDEDVSTPPICSRRIAELMPNARLVELEKVGHLSVLENADAAWTELRGLLEHLESQRRRAPRAPRVQRGRRR